MAYQGNIRPEDCPSQEEHDRRREKAEEVGKQKFLDSKAVPGDVVVVERRVSGVAGIIRGVLGVGETRTGTVLHIFVAGEKIKFRNLNSIEKVS